MKKLIRFVGAAIAIQVLYDYVAKPTADYITERGRAIHRKRLSNKQKSENKEKANIITIDFCKK